MAKKIKVAFVGTGGIAGAHLNGLVKFPDVTIAGLYDVNAARAAAAAEETGGKAYTDVETMLDTARPDVVYICTPPHGHGPAELSCCRRKIPFFVEKPVGNSMESVKKIQAAVKRSGVITSVGYMNRYRAGVNRVRELLAEDPAALIHGAWISGPPRNHPWLGIKKLSGGQNVEQTTHTFDLLRYLCGEARSVFSFAAARSFVKQVPRFETDPASSTVIRLRSGGVANIMSAWLCDAGGGIWLTLLSRNLRVDFSDWGHDVKITHAGGNWTEEIKGEENIFEIEDRAFIDAVKTGRCGGIKSNYEDGARSLALSLAADQSMAGEKPVPIR